MKKIVSLGLALLCIQAAWSQLKIDLVMSATPPAQLSEWGNRREVLLLLVSGQPGFNADFKIKTEIRLMDGTLVGNSDLNTVPVLHIASSSLVLTANDVMPLEKMIFAGKFQSTLSRTGKLPADNYSVCVQLVRPADYGPFSEVKCKNFYLASVQLPILMKPAGNEVLDARVAQTSITFRWTSVVPKPSAPVTYRLQVYEILAGQQPLQALRRNQPLLEQDITGATQYIWQPHMVFTSGDDAAAAIVTSESGINSGKDTKIVTSESGINSGKDNKIVTSESGINSGKDTKIVTSESGINSGKDAAAKQAGNTANTRSFIWTLQTLDNRGLPISQTDGNGESRSEPVIFLVRDNAKAMQQPPPSKVIYLNNQKH